MAQGALSRRTGRPQLARQSRPLRKRNRLELLEDRRLLAFTVNHTPYIQLGDAALVGYDGGADQAEILWQTTGTQDTDTFTARFRESPAGSWTNVSLNAQINTGVNDGAGVRIVHSATFAGLNFNDDYDYEITHLRGGSPIATYSSTFHTRQATTDFGDYTFVTYGDAASGDPPTNFINVQTQINALNPAFSLLLGDNVYSSGTHAEYDLRLDPSKNAALTTYNKNHIDYFGFGNHDVGEANGQAALDNYSMPIPVQDVTSPAGLVFDANVEAEKNYSYDYGAVHFLTFDTNNWTNTAALDKQLDWAVADINAAKARATPPTWIIVFGHHPIASLGGHTEHTPDDYYYDQVVSRLGPSGVGVDLLLFGHAHNYQRSYPLTGHVGATATYVLDTDDNYAKGAGLPLVVQGTGGVDVGYGASDATFAGTYLAKALDSNTSVAAQFGFGKVEVSTDRLTYSYVNTLGQVLDSFTIGTPPPDTTPPTAALAQPLDNGIVDQNPTVNLVTLSAAQANFQVQLNDSGVGIDDATVLSAAVSLTRNSLPLTAGVDYSFAYDTGTNIVSLTPLAPLGGAFGTGNYALGLTSAIKDLSTNALAPTTFNVSIDTALPGYAKFQDGLGSYSGTLDTYVHEDEPTTNHGAVNKVYADGDDDLSTAETQAQEVQGLLRFNNLFTGPGPASSSRYGGPIPDGATIINATLSVRTGTASGDISASLFNLYRMIATWDEASTWNSLTTSGVGVARDAVEASSTVTASASGGNVNVAGGLVSFDVTADVQNWSNDLAASTRGWLIHPDGVALGGNTVSGQTDGWWFDSSEASAIANRPSLTITYAVAPSGVSPGGSYSIAEGSPLTLSGTATGTGALTYSWDVNGDGNFGDAFGANPTLTWAQLIPLEITDGPASRNVAVRVSDTYGHQVDSATTLLTINNAPPTADAGGPYTIVEGNSLNLAGSGSDPAGAADPLTYAWDLDGDNDFDDATGANPTVAWATLVGMGYADGPGTFSQVIRVRVDDGDGGVAESTAVDLTVDNAPPTAGITGPASVARGASANYTLTAADPAPADQAAGFIWSIDWNGDGSDIQVVNGLSGLVVAHSFSTVGVRTIKVTATDNDGGVSSQSTHAVAVSAVQVISGDLVWTGTAGDDSVGFEDLGGGDIRVTTTLDNGLATNFVETISSVTGIVKASGLAGNDTLDAALLSTTSATLDGSTGNNTLYGGCANDVLIGGANFGPQVNGPEGQQGNNIIVGGAGDDTIYGNAVNGAEGKGGNNILLGGAGNDTIYGNWTDGGEGGGRNIIVGGADADTLYDYKLADGAEGKGSILIADDLNVSLGVPELQQIMLEWSSTHNYNDRVANILGPGASNRLNGTAYLQPGNNVTSDAAVDQLWGTTTGTGLNWFLYTLAVDQINRDKVGEMLTTL